MRSFIVLLILSPALITGKRIKYDKCFSAIPRRTIDNSKPIASFELISVQTCMMQCIQSTINFQDRECFSFTYDRIQHNCEIYDHDGKKVPAIMLPAMNFDFYKKVSVDSQCGVAEKVAAKGPNNQATRNLEAAGQMNFHNIEQEILRATNDLLKPSSTVKPLESPDIPCHTSKGYYVVIGNEILLPQGYDQSAITEFPNIEQGNCATICSKEQGPDGQKLKCNSLNYFPMTQKCQILSILAEPHGVGELVENSDSIYAEKFCLPEHEGFCQDDEVFILQVERRIKAQPMKETISQSITSCLEACLNTKGCASSVFDSGRQRCLLHSTKIGSDLSITEVASGYVLIENGCFKNTQQTVRDNSNWTDWSACQFKLKGKPIRTRTRECEDCEDFQYEECQSYE